nr:MAK10-like protein [Tanacetum cinerariifolium]
MGDENPICTLRDYSKPSREGYRNTIELPVRKNVAPFRSDTILLVQNRCSFHEFLSEDPNQNLKDFLKLVDSLDLDDENRERTRLSHLAPTLPKQMNKITTSCEICSGPYDTQYCMEDLKKAFVEYISSRIDEAGENKDEEKVSPENIDVNPFMPPDPSVLFITEKVLKLISFFKSLGLVPQSSKTELVCIKGDDGGLMFIEIVKKYDDSHEEEPEAKEHEVEYFDIFSTRSELAYYKYLMCERKPRKGQIGSKPNKNGKHSNLKDSIDQTDLANLDDLFVDPTPEMFTDEQPPDYSFSPRFDVYPEDFLEIESDANNFYDDSFDSKGEKIKESELLVDQFDLPCDILPYSEYDSFNSQDFSRDDDLPSPDNEDKDFDPPFYELFVFKEVPNSRRLLPFSSENEEKVFKPGIYTFEKVHSCFILKLPHP